MEALWMFFVRLYYYRLTRRRTMRLITEHFCTNDVARLRNGDCLRCLGNHRFLLL